MLMIHHNSWYVVFVELRSVADSHSHIQPTSQGKGSMCLAHFPPKFLITHLAYYLMRFLHRRLLESCIKLVSLVRLESDRHVFVSRYKLDDMMRQLTHENFFLASAKGRFAIMWGFLRS